MLGLNLCRKVSPTLSLVGLARFRLLCEHGRRLHCCRWCYVPCRLAEKPAASTWPLSKKCRHGIVANSCELCPRRQRKRNKRSNSRPICHHDRRRSNCPRGHHLQRCTKCGTNSERPTNECPHGRKSTLCLTCGGAAFCQHRMRRNRCRACGGRDVCAHGRKLRRCSRCRT